VGEHVVLPDPAELGPLEISVTPVGPVDAATADAFAELGVDRLIVSPRPAEDAARSSCSCTIRPLSSSAQRGIGSSRARRAE
jgi:hypothetical protein